MTDQSIAALWAVFEPRRVKPRKAGAETSRLYTQLVAPVFADTQIADITFEQIEDFHAGMRDTPYQANRVLALMNSLMKYAIALRWIHHNPVKEVRKFPERKRRRHMKAEEAPTIARAIALRENTAPDSCLFLWLLIFTGARSGEIRNARWSDLKGNVLFLKEHKTSDATGTDRIIEIPAAGVEKLNQLAPAETRHPDRKIITISRPDALWQRKVRVDAGCPDLRVHDLRHTFGTYALERGYSLDQIGEALNHSNPSTTKIYAELTDRSRQRIANDVSLGILADMYVIDSDDVDSPLK